MSKLIRFQPLTSLAFAGLTVVALTSGCNGKDPLSSATTACAANLFQSAPT